MKLTFLGANRQVTGSCYAIHTDRVTVVIDAGMFQERAFLERNWNPFPINPDRIDALLLTHAHLDHCGLIPKLVHEGFHGPIYTTAPTVDLAQLVMADAAKIQEEDAAYKQLRHKRECREGRFPCVPLYTVQQAEAVMRHMRPVEYKQPIKVAEGITATFRDAGHILGSASIQVTVLYKGIEKKLLFSGDVGRWDQPLLQDPTLFDGPAQLDAVIMESTYGDKEHPDTDPNQQLAQVIRDTAARGGKVIIPTFAIERAQELIWRISQLLAAKQVPSIPIYLDSPMASEATAIFLKYPQWMDDATRKLIAAGRDPLHFPTLHILQTAEQSKAINDRKEPCVIMAPSGMCTGGRIKHHLRNNLPNPRNTVLFVGYQAIGTLGRQILDGNREVRIHGQMIPVQAHLQQIAGFSAHADRSDLLRWISAFNQPPKNLFLTHGEERVSLALAQRITADKHWNVTVPNYRQTVEL